MRWILKLALFIPCFFLTARFCKAQTGSFTVSRISSDLNYHSAWDIQPLPPDELAQVKQLLGQPYYYLGKGVQSFVFGSEDEEYVIKFFRHDHLSTPFWQKLFPLAQTQIMISKKESRLHKDFESYKLAYEKLKDETGLIFLHLNKTSDFGLTLELVDKLGIHHRLPLDQFEFLIQKKATLLYTALEQMIQQGHLEDSKEALTKLVFLLAKRMQKGLLDKDPDLNTNFGMIGTDPIQIDVGRFRRRDPRLDKNEIIRITDHLHQWLMVRSPELDQHLKTQIENLTL